MRASPAGPDELPRAWVLTTSAAFTTSGLYARRCLLTPRSLCGGHPTPGRSRAAAHLDDAPPTRSEGVQARPAPRGVPLSRGMGATVTLTTQVGWDLRRARSNSNLQVPGARTEGPSSNWIADSPTGQPHVNPCRPDVWSICGETEFQDSPQTSEPPTGCTMPQHRFDPHSRGVVRLWQPPHACSPLASAGSASISA